MVHNCPFFLFSARIATGEAYSEDEVKQAETFMRITPLDSPEKPSNNRAEMLRLVHVTYKSRRDFVVNGTNVSAGMVLNRYPRMRDMPDALRIFYLITYSYCFIIVILHCLLCVG